jgi:hypothetical protein
MQKADPSTALRFAQDGNFEGGLLPLVVGMTTGWWKWGEGLVGDFYVADF